MSKPILSICIPTYNRSDLLFRAVKSAVNQSYKNIEIIISDNSSSGEHWININDISKLDKRIIINRNEENIGFSGNLNKCLEVATGDYILFLCDDDELFPEIVEKQVAFFNKYPNVGLVHTDGYDCSTKTIQRRVNYPNLLEAGDVAVKKIFFEMSIFFSSTMVKRTIYLQLGQFTKTSSPDWEMWARIAKYYDIGFINEPLIKMYGHTVSKRNPKDYDKEANFLREKILSYLKGSINHEKYTNIFNKNTGIMYMSLGFRACGEGNFRLGIKYITTGLPYLNTFTFLKMLIKMIIKLPVLIIKHKFTYNNSSRTYI